MAGELRFNESVINLVYISSKTNELYDKPQPETKVMDDYLEDLLEVQREEYDDDSAVDDFFE